MLIRPSSISSLLVDLTSFIAMLVLMSLFWEDDLTCTIYLSILFAVRFSLFSYRHDILYFAIGFVFASIAEIVQVEAGLYTYSYQSPLVIPYLNFFLWGFVFLLTRKVVATLEGRLGYFEDRLRGQLNAQFFVENGLYFAVTALLCLVGHHDLLIASVFAAVLLLRVAIFYRPGDLWYLLLGMSFGPLVEGYFVHLGMYRFQDPVLYNLPLWHPIYWGIIILYLRFLMTWLESCFRRYLPPRRSDTDRGVT